MDRKYYRVITNLYDTKIPDPLEYGYEYASDFRHALWQLIDVWKKRAGEAIDERNGFRLLRFHDTPGGRPDEAWIPCCLMVEEENPEYTAPEPQEVDELTAEIDSIFGFD